jgi:hypothetical protein
VGNATLTSKTEKDMSESMLYRKFMNTKELSALLDIPEGTLRQWRCSGVGPKWHKMRGNVRYDESVVEEFIHQSERIPSVRALMEENLGLCFESLIVRTGGTRSILKGSDTARARNKKPKARQQLLRPQRLCGFKSAE